MANFETSAFIQCNTSAYQFQILKLSDAKIQPTIVNYTKILNNIKLPRIHQKKRNFCFTHLL